MADVVETTFDIRVKNIFALLVDVTKDCCNCIMSTASRSETIAVGLKQGLPLGFQSLFGKCLHDSIEHHRYSERPLLCFPWFWYPDASERFWFPFRYPFRVNGLCQGESTSWWNGFDSVYASRLLALVVLSHSPDGQESGRPGLH